MKGYQAILPLLLLLGGCATNASSDHGYYASDSADINMPLRYVEIWQGLQTCRFPHFRGLGAQERIWLDTGRDWVRFSFAHGRMLRPDKTLSTVTLWNRGEQTVVRTWSLTSAEEADLLLEVVIGWFNNGYRSCDGLS
jgi:hypothetical protein